MEKFGDAVDGYKCGDGGRFSFFLFFLFFVCFLSGVSAREKLGGLEIRLTGYEYDDWGELC